MKIDRHDLALSLGESILNSIDKMQKDAKSFTKEIVIPFKLPVTSADPNFVFSVGIKMPRFTFFNADGSIETVTMAEYYGWAK